MSVNKIAVVGSRDFSNYEVFERIMDKYLRGLPIAITLVSGGAKGADSLAERYAREKGFAIEVIRAKWNDLDPEGKKEKVIIKSNQYGKYNVNAGKERNHEIVKNCDLVIAFMVGYSSGTAHDIMIALEQNKKVELFQFDTYGKYKYNLSSFNKNTATLW